MDSIGLAGLGVEIGWWAFVHGFVGEVDGFVGLFLVEWVARLLLDDVLGDLLDEVVAMGPREPFLGYSLVWVGWVWLGPVCLAEVPGPVTLLKVGWFWWVWRNGTGVKWQRDAALARAGDSEGHGVNDVFGKAGRIFCCECAKEGAIGLPHPGNGRV